jgi:hypothetical protein
MRLFLCRDYTLGSELNSKMVICMHCLSTEQAVVAYGITGAPMDDM